MNLTDLANHICAQCGMTDTDDASSAMMFLQRRLEMIWNTQLWRSSLIEGTMTINPDGTCSLGNTVWIPSRATLLLPPEFDSVLAVRQDGHSMSVASLESYYRTDADWLSMKGDPTEFQILSPAVFESLAVTLFASAAAAVDNGKLSSLKLVDATGVTKSTNSVALQNALSLPSSAMRVESFSKPPTTGSVDFGYLSPVDLSAAQYSGSPMPVATIPITAGRIYSIVPGVNENGIVLINGSQTVTLAAGVTVNITAHGASLTLQYPNLVPAGSVYGTTYGGLLFYVQNVSYASNYSVLWGAGEISAFSAAGQFAINSGAGNVDILSAGPGGTTNMYFRIAGGQSNPFALVTSSLYLADILSITASVYLFVPVATLQPTDTAAPINQRIRLTTQPQLSVNLRVLGKTSCPILGAYDTMPINNVEPCLMAYARGDMLLRQRQNGKAQIAAQEGASLLAQLARSEAFQTASSFRIVPDNGFGDCAGASHGTDSLHPL